MHKQFLHISRAKNDMSRRLDSRLLSRRGALKASLMAPAAALHDWSRPTDFGAQLFSDVHVDLRQLAQKVMPELHRSIGPYALRVLTKQLAPLASQASASIDQALVLLHSDDLANARTYDVHGVSFSLTQLGILATLLATPSGAA